jgi:hypothetical protein
MLAQAVLTAVAVVGLLVLLAAVVPSSLVPGRSFLAQWPESEDMLTNADGANNNNNNNTNNNTNINTGSSIAGTSLEYYVHVEVGAPNLAQLLAPVNSTKSASFGTAQLFAFNVTVSASDDASTATVVGVMRGYTLQSAYSSGQSFLVEVEVLEYHNPSSGVNGTISIQGLVLNSPSTLAVVGGTGHFLAARGSVFIQQHTSTVYHHTVRFI